MLAGDGAGDLGIGRPDERLDGQLHQVDQGQGELEIPDLRRREEIPNVYRDIVTRQQVDGPVEVRAQHEAPDRPPTGHLT